jgi:hypothetical protein
VQRQYLEFEGKKCAVEYYRDKAVNLVIVKGSSIEFSIKENVKVFLYKIFITFFLLCSIRNILINLVLLSPSLIRFIIRHMWFN